MSGGSYNYLCYAEELGSLSEKIDELTSMYNRLIDLDYADAARETMELILILKQTNTRVSLIAERLQDVWKSIEWYDSSDTGIDGVHKAIKEYRKE